MTSDRSSDPSTFDALWDLDPDGGEDADIPPALDPRAARGATPHDKRDTLAPPVPAAEYVETMMRLGEIDDPPGKPAAAPPGRPRRTADASAPLGAVLAKESELLLPTREAAPTGEPAAPAPRRPPTSPGPTARRAARAPSGGFRLPTALPVPRAPSIPPLPGEGADDDAPPAHKPTPYPGMPAVGPGPVTSLDSLDSLDSINSLELMGVLKKQASSREIARPGPPSSGRAGGSAGTAGLRLGRTGPRPDDDGDRVTPVAPESAPSSVAGAAHDMLVLFEAHNYGGALVSAEAVLVSDPKHAEARRIAERCRDNLGQKYLSSLGGKPSIPRVCMTPDEIRDLSLDHRAGFLLSFIDGSTSIEEVLDASSMPELDVLRMMFELRQQGAVEIHEPPRRGGRK